MAVTTKVKRLANSRHRKRRRMTAKQIKFFGTARQKAALRRRKTNPKRRKVQVSRKTRRRRTRRTNPALVVTLGSLNPIRRSTMVRRRRKVKNVRRRRVARNPRRYARRRRRNATRVVFVAPKRRNRRRHYAKNPRRRVSHRRRNPGLLGHPFTSKDSLKLIGGGLVGVAATKFIPTLIPTSITGSFGSTTFGRVIISAVAAVASGWGAGKLDPEFGNGVMFGGLMQVASVALNAFLPGFTVGGVPIGLGDLMPGQFVVPQNPIRAAIPAPAPATPTNARVTMNGLARAFGTAF